MSVYILLFILAFGAATVLPLQSEAALSAFLLAGHSALWLVVVASAGNILGSIVNWWIGLKIETFRDKRWFPVKPATLARVQGWYHRYGYWSLLLSWVPFIGDPLTVIAGVMRERLWVFIAFVSVAKTARYAVLALMVIKLSG